MNIKVCGKLVRNSGVGLILVKINQRQECAIISF
jgi:hypothetical protein